MRITKDVLASLKELGVRSSLPVGILFIPTKELGYATADESWFKGMTGKFADLARNERTVKLAFLDHCASLGVVCIDAASWMVKATQKGIVLYRADSDGHPIAEGYRQIALAGQEALNAMGVQPR